MRGTTLLISVSLVALATWGPATHTTLAFEDINGDGYVGRPDAAAVAGCVSGPGVSAPSPECAAAFDFDGDGDVDGADFATFITRQGHLPVPLKDTLGNALPLTSTVPYSGRQTCTGSCHAHDMNVIANGMKFQQGRTAVDGTIIVRDDYFGDGRWWIRGLGTC
jgi:hypothetical protein